MKATRTWILIADGNHARILESIGSGRGLHEIAGREIRRETPPSHLLGRDKPGRVHESVGDTRHAIEPKYDRHRNIEKRFAEQLAGQLQGCVEKKEFDKLVIVAPPQMLGDLRKYLTNEVAVKIVGEIAKDLAKVPNHEISSHLADVVIL